MINLTLENILMILRIFVDGCELPKTEQLADNDNDNNEKTLSLDWFLRKCNIYIKKQKYIYVF